MHATVFAVSICVGAVAARHISSVSTESLSVLEISLYRLTGGRRVLSRKKFREIMRPRRRTRVPGRASSLFNFPRNFVGLAKLISTRAAFRTLVSGSLNAGIISNRRISTF